MVQQAPVRGDIRALVVDDDPQVLRVINRQLERLGISAVQTAADGEEAMRLVTSAPQPYDVVLCDLSMPNEDGLVLLRRLADCSDKPAVILTSGEGAPMLEAARRLAESSAGDPGRGCQTALPDDARATAGPTRRRTIASCGYIPTLAGRCGDTRRAPEGRRDRSPDAFVC